MPSESGISFEGYVPGVSNLSGIVPSDKFGTNRFSGTRNAIVAKRAA
jgi:hypothetical protein